jgi:hypothetical protein
MGHLRVPQTSPLQRVKANQLGEKGGASVRVGFGGLEDRLRETGAFGKPAVALAPALLAVSTPRRPGALYLGLLCKLLGLAKSTVQRPAHGATALLCNF